MSKKQTPLTLVREIVARVDRGETVRIRWGDEVRGYSGGTIDHLIQSPLEGVGADRSLVVDLWGHAPTAMVTIVWFHLEKIEILEEEQTQNRRIHNG